MAHLPSVYHVKTSKCKKDREGGQATVLPEVEQSLQAQGGAQHWGRPVQQCRLQMTYCPPQQRSSMLVRQAQQVWIVKIDTWATA
jgi:hypothetical protein